MHPQHNYIAESSNSRTIGGGTEVQTKKNYLRAFREGEFHWFKPILSLFFVVTTPFGMDVVGNIKSSTIVMRGEYMLDCEA